MNRVLTPAAAIFLVVLFYVCFSLFNYCMIEEDAFIFFRFVENIVNGNGHVFNRPDGRIEACSSLPWLYLLVLFRTFGCDLPTVSKMLGICFGGVSLLLLYRIGRILAATFIWAIIPTLLAALSVPFLFWNQMGMETALYTAIFLCFILVSLDTSLFFWWPLCAVLLMVTRPEGIFIVLGMIPSFIFAGGWTKEMRISAALFVSAAIMLLVARFLYFHDFFPSAFYHKVSPGQHWEGLYYVHMFFRDHFLYALCIPLAGFIGRRWNWERKRLIVFTFIVVHLTWVVLAGKEFGKPFYRPLVPVIPLIYVYVVTGAEKMLAGWGARRKLLAYGYLMLFAIAALLLSRNYWQLHLRIPNPVWENIKYVYANSGVAAAYRARIAEPLRSRQVLIGDFIRRNYAPGSTLVYDQMGAVPYRAGIEYNFIDTLGLTDKTIGYYYFHQRISGSTLLLNYERMLRWCIGAVSPGTEFCDTTDDVLDYLFNKQPDLILVWEYLLNFKHNLAYALMSDKRFPDNYALSYFISGTFFFEKKGMVRKPLDIPPGLSVVGAEEIPRVLKKDHPLFQLMGVKPCHAVEATP